MVIIMCAKLDVKRLRENHIGAFRKDVMEANIRRFKHPHVGGTGFETRKRGDLGVYSKEHQIVASKR